MARNNDGVALSDSDYQADLAAFFRGGDQPAPEETTAPGATPQQTLTEKESDFLAKHGPIISLILLLVLVAAVVYLIMEHRKLAKQLSCSSEKEGDTSNE